MNCNFEFFTYNKINTAYICAHTHTEIKFTFLFNNISYHTFDFKSQENSVTQHYYESEELQVNFLPAEKRNTHTQAQVLHKDIPVS